MPYPADVNRPRPGASSRPAPRGVRLRKNWERAYEEIKRLILVMGIRPGENLSENALAKRLGISRTPVREALKALEREGLVVSERGRKRAFVLTIRDIDEIFDLKIAVEGKIARWAAERGTPTERAALSRVADRMAALARREPPPGAALDDWHGKWLALDEEYHDLLFRMAGNRRAEQTIRIQNSLWHRLRLGIIAIEGRIGRSTGEHGGIARAVVAGRAGDAERLMADHLRRLQDMLRGIMEAFHYPPVDTGRGK
jgi:DNA-binding GntR family transcriptional regulator